MSLPGTQKTAMRKITNNAGLPAPLVRAIQLDPYSKGDCDYTTTSLIKPPRILALERRHEDEIVEDASDRIWSLFGQLGHLVLERAGMRELVERRFTVERMGKKIGGQVDLWLSGEVLSGVLIDYKFTSQWAAKDGVKPEWEQQANINALLCRENGFHVFQAQIVAIYRDWSVGEARRNQDYPQTQVQVFPVKLWPAEQQESFIADRIAMHVDAERELPLCTELERWARPEKWAVMKAGREKAVKLFDDSRSATDLSVSKPGHYVEHRPGVQTRCLDYCPCLPFCSQAKELGVKVEL